MRKVKFALAGVALATVTLTMSFSMTNNDGKTAAQDNDCWSTEQQHLMGQPADRSTIDCPANNVGCCVKPDPSNPGQYLQFAEN